MDARRLQFGLVPPPSFASTNDRVNELLRWVSDRSGTELARRQVASYDDLARLLRNGVLQVAWLPPILLARLDVEGVVRELVCADRGDATSYVSALLARAGAGVERLEDVRGKRVGWVDPLSAAGYVVPRIRLAQKGLPPATTFAEETFLGAHGAVVRAIVEGTVDVGATYAGFDGSGRLVRGAFAETGARPEDLVVVATFGPVPSDVIAVHASVPEDVASALAEAFEAASSDPRASEAIALTFGAERLTRQPIAGHDLLRAEIDVATASDVIPAAAAFLSSRPPSRT